VVSCWSARSAEPWPLWHWNLASPRSPGQPVREAPRTPLRSKLLAESHEFPHDAPFEVEVADGGARTPHSVSAQPDFCECLGSKSLHACRLAAVPNPPNSPRREQLSAPLRSVPSPWMTAGFNRCCARSSASFSDRFRYPRVLRGRSLRLRAMRSRSRWLSRSSAARRTCPPCRGDTEPESGRRAYVLVANRFQYTRPGTPLAVTLRPEQALARRLATPATHPPDASRPLATRAPGPSVPTFHQSTCSPARIAGAR